MHTLRAITSTHPGSRSPANRRATILRKAARALALAGAAATVHAGVKASAVNPDAWYGPADEVYLPLTAAGAVTLTFNLTRQPAATIPCGLDREGLPIGLQIVSGHARDALVLRAAAAYERVRPIPAPPMAHQI